MPELAYTHTQWR